MIRRMLAIYLSVFILALLIGLNFVGEEKGEGINWVELFIYILASTLVMLIIIKLFGSSWLIKLIEVLAIGFSVYILALGILYPFGNIAGEVALLLGIAALIARLLSAFRNELAALSAAGIAGIIGISISPISALLFLFAIAAYDYIAVFATRHMQTLARALSKEETAFSIKEVRKVVKKGKVEEEFLEIGTGDLLMPSLVATSFLNADITYSLGVIAGTMIGFWLLIETLRKHRRMLPAMPFLFTGIIIGLFITFILRVMFRYMKLVGII